MISQLVMKKLLQSTLVAAMSLFAVNSFGQMANGSMAPTLNLTDLNGNTYDVDALLAAGKTVFIDVSATWCGPCWNFHQTHILDDLYSQYGPSGTNEVMVFWVEGDGSTSVAEISGSGSSTQGDWTAGTTFPMVDDAAAANALEIGYFPTLYMICPSRRVWHISPSEVGDYWPVATHIANARACTNPIDAVMNGYTGETSTCGYVSQLKVKVQNKGVNTLTSATITASVAGVTVASKAWTGNLEQFQSAEVNIGANTFTSDTDVDFTITPNGTDVAPSDNLGTQTISMAPEVSNTTLIVKVTTDRYGSETTWKLRKGNNAVLSSGGPFTDLAANGEGVQADVTVTLPANDCYKFEMIDAYGDGMCCNYGNGGYEVTDGNGTVLISGGQFGTSEQKRISYGVTSVEDESAVAGVNIFPNPSNGVCNVTMSLTKNEDVSFRVYNVLGSLVSSRDMGTLTPGEYIYQMDMSAQAAGVYTLVMQTNSGVKSYMISINR